MNVPNVCISHSCSYLTYEEIGITEAVNHLFKKCVGECRKLVTYLNISNTTINDCGLKSALKKYTSITSLNISHCENITGIGIQPVLSDVKLVSFDFSHSMPTYDCSRALGVALVQRDSVHLNLSGLMGMNKWFWQGFIARFSKIESFSLDSADYHFDFFSDECAHFVAEGFRLAPLKSVALGPFAHLEELGWMALCKGLWGKPLVSLSLSTSFWAEFTKIPSSPFWVNALAGMNFTELESLKIAGCAITDDGLLLLIDKVKMAPHLKHVHFEFDTRNAELYSQLLCALPWQTLVSFHCERVEANCLVSLPECVRKCQHLEQIFGKPFSLSSSGQHLVMSVLPKTIQNLDLHELSDEQIDLVLSQIDPTVIRSISLSQSFARATKLLQFLGSFNYGQIVQLNLSGYKINQEVIDFVASKLPLAIRLEELHLNGADASYEGIINSLNSTALRVLGLNGGYMHREQIKSKLTKFKRIQVVSLTHDNILSDLRNELKRLLQGRQYLSGEGGVLGSEDITHNSEAG